MVKFLSHYHEYFNKQCNNYIYLGLSLLPCTNHFFIIQEPYKADFGYFLHSLSEISKWQFRGVKLLNREIQTKIKHFYP